MFSFVLFLCLVSSHFSLAPPSSPLPSDSEHRRSFLLRARCRIPTTIHFLSSIWTPTAFYIRRRAICRRQGTPFPTFRSLFPHFSLSLRSLHCIATNSDSTYKYSSPALLKNRQLWPKTFPIFVCVRSGQLRPILSVSFLISLRSLVSLAVRSDSSHRHSTSPSANPCVPSRPSPAYFRV
jgi:hypothetical protein